MMQSGFFRRMISWVLVLKLMGAVVWIPSGLAAGPYAFVNMDNFVTAQDLRSASTLGFYRHKSMEISVLGQTFQMIPGLFGDIGSAYIHKIRSSAQSLTYLILNHVPGPDVQAGLTWESLRFRRFSMRLTRLLSLYFPSRLHSYDLQLRYGPRGAMGVKRELSHKSAMSCAPYLQFQRPDASALEQDKKDVGVSCALEWRLGASAVKAAPL